MDRKILKAKKNKKNSKNFENTKNFVSLFISFNPTSLYIAKKNSTLTNQFQKIDFCMISFVERKRKKKLFFFVVVKHIPFPSLYLFI